MSQWARVVAVILTVGAVAGCSSSDSASEEEVAELRDQIEELTGLLDGRDERIDELTAQLDELEAAAATTMTAADTSDVQALLPLAADLPGDWSEDGAVFDFGFEEFGVGFVLAGPCGVAPVETDEPVAVASTAFSAAPVGRQTVAVAAMRFADEDQLARLAGQLVASTSTCDTFFEDPNGSTSISPLDLTVDGADVAATRSTAESEDDPSGFVMFPDSHDVVARVGPYLLVVVHLDEEEPDLAVTTAVVEAMIARANEALAG